VVCGCDRPLLNRGGARWHSASRPDDVYALNTTIPSPAAQPFLLLRGACATLTPASLVTSAPRLDAAVERSLQPEVVYYSEKKPLANVKGFERRRLAPALRSNATAADLVAILKSAAAATAWQAQVAAAEACPVREWVYFSASNSSRTAQHVRTRLDVDALVRLVGGSAGHAGGETARATLEAARGAGGITMW